MPWTIKDMVQSVINRVALGLQDTACNRPILLYMPDQQLQKYPNTAARLGRAPSLQID